MPSDFIKDKVLRYDGFVPRYTSYPTAPHFRTIEDVKTFDYKAVYDHQDTLSLYIHIPFCHQMCWYCGCHTKVTKQYAPIAQYIEYLKKEIALISDMLSDQSCISHLHFGGGSPGILEAKDFDDLMTCIQNHFQTNQDTEIAIEIDPRIVTEAKIATYAKSGVNRISLGVQDFDDRVLKSVNRVQPFHLTYQAVQLFHSYGIDNISFDLLYGLPHQTEKTLLDTIDKALILKPNRLSLFGYAHVPWMKKHMRLMPEKHLPDASLRYDLFEAGRHILAEKGYHRIGIDHFSVAKDDLYQALCDKKLRRNFQGYTTDQAEAMIGLGVSSIGRAPSYFVQNTPDLPVYKDYLKEGKMPVKKYYALSKDDQIRADIIEKIMCYFLVDLKYYNADFSHELEQLRIFEEQGFVAIEDQTVSIKDAGHPLTRVIASLFDSYFQRDRQVSSRHSQAV